ncbi:uncharacterized protein PAC_03030 [Phialocephala subalpina]|uniref:Uncharacterized protein n=1 Tax=Phialocephala subalpina TaxID=576137 RepID=A0A1L7WK50_9HELO|nr:uncharacterized protein PAC_03030 [Phialocephala subalpina]
MTKQHGPKGGGLGGKTDETKNIQNANEKSNDIKPAGGSEKRTQRIMLKSNPPKSTPRITLRTKQGESSKAPSKSSSTQRARTRATTSTPTRSSHIKSRAGTSSGASPCRAGTLPVRTAHPDKLREWQSEKAPPVHFSRRAPSLRSKTTSVRIVPKDEGHYNNEQTTPANDAKSPSPKVEPPEQEDAEFEHLSNPSQVTGPNTFLVKVLSEHVAMHENEGADWELVGYPKPVSPLPVSIVPASTYNAAMLHKPKAENTSSLSKVPATFKPSMPSNTSDSHGSARGNQMARCRGKSEEDLESRIRSILTEPSRAQRRADFKNHNSVKSVKWDPSIIPLDPVPSPETTSTKATQSAASSNRQKLDDSLKEFTNTVKDLKKGDRRLLADLLEALRNVESDDESSSDLADQKDKPETTAGVLHTPMTTGVGFANRESKSDDRTQMVTESKSNDFTPKAIRESKPNVHTSTATTATEQKTYRDALASVLSQPPVSTQPANRDRSKSLSSDQTTLVGSEDTCIKTTKAPNLRVTTKLNPRAPVFAGFGHTKHKAIRSDPVEEMPHFITTIQKRHHSHDDGVDGLKQVVPVAAKVGKYVPPALRGDRKFHQPEKKPQEPVWVRIRPDQPPNKLSEPGVHGSGGLETIKTSDDDCHQGLGDHVLNHGLTEKQNQAEWLDRWLRDAAKPHHGLGNYSGEPQPVLQGIEPHVPSYGQAIQDFALTTQVHENTTGNTTDLLGPLPMEWAPINQNMMQYHNLPADYYSLRTLPVVGSLIPIPPPVYFGQPYLQKPAPMQLLAPLIPEPEASKVCVSTEGKPGRIAKPLESVWADKVLNNFTSRFPMTGKCQSNFPVPPIQELDTKAAHIQQKLELLILKQKEKKAYERRSRSSAQRASNDRMSSLFHQSENLITFD